LIKLFAALNFLSKRQGIYIQLLTVLGMTKTVSLSEEAYKTLRDLKRPEESFLDVVLRITGQKQQKEKKSLLEFAGKWEGDDIDEVFVQLKKDREQSKSRDVQLT